MFQKLFHESGLSLERLNTLHRMAESGGFARAAPGDATTQSLFSRQIKELEEYFGLALTRRNGKRIVLTEAGKELASIVREHLSALADFNEKAHARPLTVSIAVGDSLIHWLLLPGLQRLKKQLPNTKFLFLNLRSAEIRKRLYEGTIDFGLLKDGVFPASVKKTTVGTMRYSLFVPSNVVLPSDPKEILRTIPMAILEGDGAFRRNLAAIFEKHRIHANIEVECSSLPLVARAVQTSKLAAVLPSIAAREFSIEAVTGVELPLFEELTHRVVLAWNSRVCGTRPIVDKARRVFPELMKF